MKDLTYRPATIDNFDKLWQLVEESLSGKETKITRTSLREDLFGARKLELGSVATGHEEPSVELDLNLDQAQASVPFCQVFLAQMGCQQVGYLMFHQFYSPWKGRKACIDYIYVKQKYRNMGIASGLMQRLKDHCKTDGSLDYLVFDVSRLDSGLRNTLAKHGAEVLRDDNTDWSVFRIEF